MSANRCDECGNLHAYCQCHVPAPPPPPAQDVVGAVWVLNSDEGYDGTRLVSVHTTVDGAKAGTPHPAEWVVESGDDGDEWWGTDAHGDRFYVWPMALLGGAS